MNVNLNSSLFALEESMNGLVEQIDINKTRDRHMVVN